MINKKQISNKVVAMWAGFAGWSAGTSGAQKGFEGTLLKKNKLGELDAKKLSKDKIKDILLSHSANRSNSVMESQTNVTICHYLL